MNESNTSRGEKPVEEKGNKAVYFILLALLGSFVAFLVIDFFIRRRNLRQLEQEQAEEEEREIRKDIKRKIGDVYEPDVSNVKSDLDIIQKTMTCLRDGSFYYINTYKKLGICGNKGVEMYVPSDEATNDFYILQNVPIKKIEDIERKSLTVQITGVRLVRQSYISVLKTGSKKNELVRDRLEDGKQIYNILVNAKGELASMSLPFRKCTFRREDVVKLGKLSMPPISKFKNMFIIIYKSDGDSHDIFLSTTIYIKITVDKKSYYDTIYLPNSLPTLRSNHLTYTRKPFVNIFRKPTKDSSKNPNMVQDSDGVFSGIRPYKIIKNIIDWNDQKFDFMYV